MNEKIQLLKIESQLQTEKARTQIEREKNKMLQKQVSTIKQELKQCEKERRRLFCSTASSLGYTKEEIAKVVGVKPQRVHELVQWTKYTVSNDFKIQHE